MADIVVTGLGKSFEGVKIFSKVSMKIERGVITAVLGPSGRGKTTLLRIICGLEKQDVGTLEIKPGLSCAMAFQEPRLLPWLTVDANMGYSLGEEGLARAKDWLCELGLKDFGARFPLSLSGGEQQRVNLARALSSNARILLMDEPFNSIGLGMKAKLLPRLRKILIEEGRTVIMVTHSPVDVALMADCFYLMDGDGAGVEGPLGIELTDDARNLEDEAMGRQIHRLMLLMASLEPGVKE